MKIIYPNGPVIEIDPSKLPNGSRVVVRTGQKEQFSIKLTDVTSISIEDAAKEAWPVLPKGTPGSSVGGEVPSEAEAVDLALPSGTLWAPWNVGADKPESIGAYFAWGETTSGKKKWFWDTYKYVNKEGDDPVYWDSEINKYQVEDLCDGCCWYSHTSEDGDKRAFFIGDGKGTLEQEDDAAAANWGGRWRMPTAKQFKELVDENNCKWQWTMDGGRAGLTITSIRNGSTLFLPAAGWNLHRVFHSFGFGREPSRRESEDDLEGVGKFCSYWTSQVYSGQSTFALYLTFSDYKESKPHFENVVRCGGLSVRAVICKS